MHIEREIKLRASPAAQRRLWRLVRPIARVKRRPVHSVYFDTAEQRLRRAGMALRLRRDGRRWLQALKAELAVNPGLAARNEWEQPASAGKLDIAAFPRDEILAATGVDLKRLGARLKPIFETRFVRSAAEVLLSGDTRVEVCIDQGVIGSGPRSEPLLEIELELRAGEASAMLRLAEQIAAPLALELEIESKAERGYRLAAGEALAPPRKWRKPSLQEFTTPEEAFPALFSAALSQVAANVNGVRRSRDPEYLHQMRVGLRRLRSVLRAFRAFVTRASAKPLMRRLDALGPALGSARDWDVFCTWLEESAEKGELRAILSAARARRAVARRAARRSVASPEFQALLLRMLRWLHESPWRSRQAGYDASLVSFGGGALERLHRKTTKGARDIDWRDAGRRHEVRIRIKKLRYACEYFAPCFPRTAVRPYLKRLEALQDILGELNDVAVARKLLAVLAPRGAPHALAGAALHARRMLVARERSLIASLEPAWSAFRKRRPFWHAQKAAQKADLLAAA